MNKLSGLKAYIVAAAAGIYAALIGLGVLPSLDWVWGLFGVSATAALRSGIAKGPQPPTP